jgi:hypothetical protein
MFSNEPSISMKKTMITKAPTRRFAANYNVSFDESKTRGPKRAGARD